MVETTCKLEDESTAIHREAHAGTLNILFVQEAPCIRNYKMAVALGSKGHRVTLAYVKARLSQMYKDLQDDVYSSCIQLKNHRHLWDLSKEYDIVHCHNEPDLLSVAALAGDAPVVHDTHDLISLRHGDNQTLRYFEGIANRGASGRVYVSEYQMDMARMLYAIDLSKSIVVPNFALKKMIPASTLPKLSNIDGEIHIAYEGSLSLTPDSHRYYLPLFHKIAAHGLHIHIYPAFHSPKVEAICRENKRLHYHHPISPDRIVNEVSQYDFGIVPFTVTDENAKHLASAMPNKLFEYLAAGLPVIARNLYSIRQFFEKFPAGILYNTVDDIVAGIKTSNRKVPTEVPFVFEDEIDRVERLYNGLLEYRKTGPQCSRSLSGQLIPN